MNITEYNKELSKPPTVPAGPKTEYFSGTKTVPVLARTVRTQHGACFALSTRELATTEPRYQGIKNTDSVSKAVKQSSS